MVTALVAGNRSQRRFVSNGDIFADLLEFHSQIRKDLRDTD